MLLIKQGYPKSIRMSVHFQVCRSGAASGFHLKTADSTMMFEKLVKSFNIAGFQVPMPNGKDLMKTKSEIAG